MIYRELAIPGLMIAEAEPYVDERGVFKRTFSLHLPQMLRLI